MSRVATTCCTRCARAGGPTDGCSPGWRTPGSATPRRSPPSWTVPWSTTVPSSSRIIATARTSPVIRTSSGRWSTTARSSSAATASALRSQESSTRDCIRRWDHPPARTLCSTSWPPSTWSASGSGAGVSVPDADHVEGGHDVLHKVRAGGWSHRRMQSRAEDSWERNAEAVAAELDRAVVEHRPELVLITGDVRAVAMIREELGRPTADLLVEVPGGSRADGVKEDVFGVNVHRVLEAHRARRREKITDRMREALGPVGLEHPVHVRAEDVLLDPVRTGTARDLHQQVGRRPAELLADHRDGPDVPGDQDELGTVLDHRTVQLGGDRLGVAFPGVLRPGLHPSVGPPARAHLVQHVVATLDMVRIRLGCRGVRAGPGQVDRS